MDRNEAVQKLATVGHLSIAHAEENGNIFAQAWAFGYEVEKEPRYTVRIKATNQYLCNDGIGPHFSPGFRTDFRKRDVEELGLGWVFDCPGVEVEEVER